MSDQPEIPFVATIGGFYAIRGTQEATAARQMGEQLGAALANADFGLVVYFSDADSLEPYVVKGYVAAGAKRSKSIRVRYAQSQRGKVSFPEEAGNGELFDPDVFPSDDWEAPFYRSLAQKDGVDGVLLLSGGTSTLIAGHVAVARDLPVLALPDFDGSAKKIWSALKANTPSNPLVRAEPIENRLAHMRSQWEDARKARREAERQRQRQEFMESRRTATALCAVTFAALVSILLYSFVGAPSGSRFVGASFLSMICAGATGALVRNVMATSKRDASMVLLLGGIAGFVVGLAYLIPQLISGGDGFMDPTGDVDRPERTAMMSAILVAVSAGVGFDAVFRRLQREADEVPIKPG